MIFKQTWIKLSTKKWKDVGSYKGLCPFGGLSDPGFDTEKLQIIM